MKFTPIFPIIWRKWFTILLILVNAIALTACNPTEFKTAAAQVPQLVARLSTEPKTFNYALNQSSPNVFGFIYEGLITENGINGELEPALAEKWEISADKQRIIFTLRSGLKWSDGEPLTAEDVVFTFNDVYLNERVSTDAIDVFRIGKSRALPKVRLISDRQVEFSVPEPFAPFLRLAGGSAVLPKHALSKAVYKNRPDGRPEFLSTWGTDTDLAKVIVNGPYKLESYTPSQRVTFRRNPYYWRNDASGRPQPYIDRIVWQIVESPDTALIQFRSKGLDILEIGPTSFALLKREEKRGDFTIQNAGPDTGTTFVTFNLNKGRRPKGGNFLVDPIKSRWFNTVAFRQAVAYGIDRQSMLNNIFRGLGQFQNSPISVQSPYYLSPEEGLKVYNYNLDKAKELLQGAGFKYNNKGQLFDADGNRVQFIMLAPSQSRTSEAIGSQIKRDLSKIGIEVDLQQIDFGTIVEKTGNTLEWESYFGAITGGVEPNNGANVWSVDGGFHVFNQKPLPGQPPIEGREVADWEEEIGRLYIQGARELDEAKRKAIYAETQRLAQEYLPYIHLINPLALAAVRNDIQGVKYTALGGTFWNVYEIQDLEQ